MPAAAVVVGGGLAGLVCARKMLDAGLNVTVLEAQKSPGGRIRTLRSEFADHMYCEAGAMGFLDIHTNVKALVSQLGLRASEFKSESSPTIFYLRGRRVLELPTGPAADLPGLTGPEQQLGVDGIWQKYVGTPSQQLGDPSGVNWSPAPFRDLDAITAEEYLRQQGASDAAAQLINRGLCGLYGDGVASFSALMLLLGAALMRNASADFEIVQGNDMLPRTLAQTMAPAVRYGAVVRGISQTDRGVRVTFDSPLAAASSIEADYAVCAVPFPLLAQIQFSPALPPTVQEMIASVGNTSVTRVFMQTRCRFWTDGANGAADLELSLSHARVMSAYNLPGMRGILEAYLAGPSARDADALQESTRLQSLLTTVQQSLPQAQSEFEGGHTYSWDTDVWAKGAYAFFRPGQFTKYWSYLRAPAGPIHFCGDQTSIWVGWMEGAVDSGSRAAQEVIASAIGGSYSPGPGPPDRSFQ